HVNEPRAIAVSYFVLYTALFLGGWTALVSPPSTIEGAMGAWAMTILSVMLVVGGATGAPAALLGIWWLERSAVIAVGFSAAIYGATIIIRQFTSDGNRMLQAAFVFTVLVMQVVRWHRISQRPYDPARHNRFV